MDDRFVELITPHALEMVRTAAALIGVTHAEDAAQEALLRAWRALPTLRNAQAARVWLLRITINVCRDWQRERYAAPTDLSLDGESDLSVRILSWAGRHEAGSAAHTQALDLRQAVTSLDPDLQLIVRLRYFAGMNASEIGSALGQPASTVRTRLGRALQQMRQILEGSPADPWEANDE